MYYSKEKHLKEVKNLSPHWSAMEISAWTGLRIATILEWREVYSIPHMSHVDAVYRSKRLWREMWPRHQCQTIEERKRLVSRKRYLNVRPSQIKPMARDKCEAV